MRTPLLLAWPLWGATGNLATPAPEGEAEGGEGPRDAKLQESPSLQGFLSPLGYCCKTWWQNSVVWDAGTSPFLKVLRTMRFHTTT